MEKQIYHQLLNLMLRSREEGFEPLRALSDLLDEEPIKIKLPGNWFVCNFPKAGVEVVQWEDSGGIYSLSLCVSNGKVERGEFSPYSGDLPHEIRIEDTEEEVERKYPGATVGVRYERTENDLYPLLVRFHFGVPGCDKPKSNQRKLMFVSFLGDNR